MSETPAAPIGTASTKELVAVAAAGVVHVVTELAISPVVARYVNVGIVLLFVIYLVRRARTVPGTLRDWGMRRDNFRPALMLQARFALPVAVLLYGYGAWAGHTPLPVTFWITLGLYPLWGTAQQFALQNLLARNLAPWIPRPRVHAAITALIFSAAHFPDRPLMALTLAPGFFFTLGYRRQPNLWAVGILHGLLGGMAFYLVLGQDPVGALLAYFGDR